MTTPIDIRRRRHYLSRLIIGCASLLLTCCKVPLGNVQAPSDDLVIYEKQAKTPLELGEVRFLFDDMSGLSTQALRTNAFPWKVVTTALLLARQKNPSEPLDTAELASIFREFGFLKPAAIANWQGPLAQPQFNRPIGIATGTLASPLSPFRLQVANITCAACHAGVTYNAGGYPESSVWLGQPNTSVDFEAFVEEIYRSLRVVMRDPARFIEALQSLYPDTNMRELDTIRNVVIPAIADRYREFDSEGAELPLGYYAGSSGLTNGLASLRNVLGLIPAHGGANDRGLTSIPDLEAVTLRSSLLCDGVYAPKGSERFRPLRISDSDLAQTDRAASVVAVFTVPAMGVEPKYAIHNVAKVKDIFAFLDRYEPQPFPGAIDRVKAVRGQTIYRDNCSACHGTYSAGLDNVRLVAFPNRVVSIDQIGTDPVRLALANEKVAEAVNGSAFQSLLDAKPSVGYVATRLTGVWATAPYLHNGSVPTLWDLMHPDRRPPKFEVGGHRLDFIKVGIAGQVAPDGVTRYARDYKPWAKPSLYDTSDLGQSNRGHETEFRGLTEDQKWDLIEYLKVL